MMRPNAIAAHAIDHIQPCDLNRLKFTRTETLLGLRQLQRHGQCNYQSINGGIEWSRHYYTELYIPGLHCTELLCTVVHCTVHQYSSCTVYSTALQACSTALDNSTAWHVYRVDWIMASVRVTQGFTGLHMSSRSHASSGHVCISHCTLYITECYNQLNCCFSP